MKNIEKAISKGDKFDYVEKGVVQKCFYDKKSKLFIATSRDGKIITWFKPGNAENYILNKKAEFKKYLNK